MPTERFNRLPKEKKEAIRMAAIREFQRVSPEEASINRIIRDAEISRGSFYTYFEDKYELLKWIIGDRIREYLDTYAKLLERYEGDLWKTLEDVFAFNTEYTLDNDFMKIIENMLESSSFMDMVKHRMDGKNCEPNQEDTDRLWEMLDKERYPMSRETFSDLMEMQSTVFMMSLKRLFRDQLPGEQVREYYRRHIKMLRYGADTGASGQNGKEMQEEKA